MANTTREPTDQEILEEMEKDTDAGAIKEEMIEEGDAREKPDQRKP